MHDTPEHIKDLHLKLWLSKSPGDRLLQALKNNEELFLFFKQGKAALEYLNEPVKSPVQTPPK